MGLNIIGLATAAALFLGVWIGHVLVRKLEYSSTAIIFPSTCFALIGISLTIGAFFQESALISAVLGIIGITFLWDSLEFFRQQNRIMKGHAPANPSNPRHARILEEHPLATAIDLLKRDPIGREVSIEEATRLAAMEEYGR